MNERKNGRRKKEGTNERKKERKKEGRKDRKNERERKKERKKDRQKKERRNERKKERKNERRKEEKKEGEHRLRTAPTTTHRLDQRNGPGPDLGIWPPPTIGRTRQGAERDSGRGAASPGPPASQPRPAHAMAEQPPGTAARPSPRLGASPSLRRKAALGRSPAGSGGGGSENVAFRLSIRNKSECTPKATVPKCMGCERKFSVVVRKCVPPAPLVRRAATEPINNDT